jgi:hypothetical protein
MTYDENKREQWKADRARIQERMASSHQVPQQVILDRLKSPEPLQVWLRGKPPQVIVGNSQTPDETVLANFLWETLGVFVWAFGFEAWGLEGDVIELPAWCGEFAKIEGEHSRADQSPNGDWTAAKALEMLEEMEHRLQSR